MSSNDTKVGARPRCAAVVGWRPAAAVTRQSREGRHRERGSSSRSRAKGVAPIARTAKALTRLHHRSRHTRNNGLVPTDGSANRQSRQAPLPCAIRTCFAFGTLDFGQIDIDDATNAEAAAVLAARIRSLTVTRDVSVSLAMVGQETNLRIALPYNQVREALATHSDLEQAWFGTGTRETDGARMCLFFLILPSSFF